MTDNGTRPRTPKPWGAELGRLRWLEQHAIAFLVEEWRHRAEGLRETMTGAADYTARETLDDRAATWDQAAEELSGLVPASRVGPPAAQDLDWARWHLAEVGRILAGMRPAEMVSVLAEVGSPE
jgi:hypothetical protein